MRLAEGRAALQGGIIEWREDLLGEYLNAIILKALSEAPKPKQNVG